MRLASRASMQICLDGSTARLMRVAYKAQHGPPNSLRVG
nr:MAG TPA: hypothetical protein [Bacteriophage sp.]